MRWKENLRKVREIIMKMLSKIAVFWKKTAFKKEVGIIKVAYVSYGCLVFLKSIFSALYDVKSKLIASSIHDAILQKQKNYDITYKWWFFYNWKMFMTSGIYDDLYRSGKIYDITYNVMIIFKMFYISFTWCIQTHFLKFLTYMLNVIMISPKGKKLSEK